MNRIKQLRNQKGITQDELGKVLNVQKSAVSKYELGRAVPGTDVLKKLAIYFNVTTDYILGLSDDPHGDNTKKPSDLPSGLAVTTAGTISGAGSDSKPGSFNAMVAGASIAGAAAGVGAAASTVGLSNIVNAIGPVSATLSASGAVSVAALAAYHSIKHLLDITGTAVDDVEADGSTSEKVPVLLVEPDESRLVEKYRVLSDAEKDLVKTMIDTMAKKHEVSEQ